MGFIFIGLGDFNQLPAVLEDHVDFKSAQVLKYIFDGNKVEGRNPADVALSATDIIVLDDEGNRISSRSEIPSETEVQIRFRGAFEDLENPNQPDPQTITEWFADITQLNGYPMLQWEVRFNMSGDGITINEELDPPTPGIDDVRVRFRIR